MARRARTSTPRRAAGEYEFRLAVADVAGNPFETTLRERRVADAPQLPAPRTRSSCERVSATAAPRARRFRTGRAPRSTVACSTPMASRSPDRQIVVVDRFDNGALFPRAERPVVTDEQGRSRRPSRRARRARSRRPSRAPTGTCRPRTRSADSRSRVRRLSRPPPTTIREGTAIAFTGKVKHHGARIPAGGKLVEVQYRLKTGRQRTLKEPFRTEPDGSYRLAYRFSKALTARRAVPLPAQAAKRGQLAVQGFDLELAEGDRSRPVEHRNRVRTRAVC